MTLLCTVGIHDWTWSMPGTIWAEQQCRRCRKPRPR